MCFSTKILKNKTPLIFDKGIDIGWRLLVYYPSKLFNTMYKYNVT